jgi:hypothetical protein
VPSTASSASTPTAIPSPPPPPTRWAACLPRPRSGRMRLATVACSTSPGRHHQARARLAARPAHPDWRGPDRGRHRPVCLVPRWPLPQRRRVCDAGRRRADPGLLGPDGAGQAQPVRGPPAQPGPARRRADQAAMRPSHPRLRPTPAAPQARPTARSNAAWSATSPASSTGNSRTTPALTQHRSVQQNAGTPPQTPDFTPPG